MRSKTKNMTICLLAGASALLLGGALALNAAEPAKVRAAEGVLAFVDVGASATAAEADSALSLTAENIEATTAGTVTAGDTLFAGYAVGATYTVTANGDCQVAVALDVTAGDTLTVNGESVSLDGKSGRTVVSTSVSASGTFDVAASGKLCGILVAEAGSKIPMAVDYTEGQVINYGKLLADEIDYTATVHYSDGTSEEARIEYGDITAATGVNVNFTTVDVTGVVTVGESVVPVSRYLTTMPEDLVYFINCGSSTEPDSHFPDDPLTVDADYDHNQTIFDYYGESLLNYGTPDQTTTKGGSTWGIYTEHAHNAPADATFPYNSFVWTGGDTMKNTTTMGYLLTDLDSSKEYRVWIGTLSHWHGRTVNITFNGEVVGANTLTIPATKSCTVFENVKPDASGKIDIFMTGAGTNEPTINFIAVQEMSVAIPEKPASVQGDPIIEVGQTTVTVTGVTEGAKIQLYNVAKPYQLLYEEAVDTTKLNGESYTINFGEPLTVAQFCVVQLTGGGASDTPLLVTITDITKLEAALSPDPAQGGYALASTTVTVTINAGSGVTQWLWKQGEYGEEHVFELDRPAVYVGSFVAEENDTYYVIATSGLGVTRELQVDVNNIDTARPVISLVPSVEGFGEGGYHATLRVTSVAPVVEYKLFKDGEQQGETQTSAPATVNFPSAGEYVVYIKTAAGLSSTSTVLVSAQPYTTRVEKSYTSGTCKYTFTGTDDYTVSSVSVYKIDGARAERQTIDSGNVFNAYNAGQYVVTVTTGNGAVEMFTLNVTQEDVRGTAEEGCGSSVSGIAFAALALGACLVFTKKKKS